MEARITLPSVPLKAVVIVHFILTVWANQRLWLPASYQFCNFLVLAVGVWAIASPESQDASQMFFFGMLFTILHDIIVISIYYKTVPDGVSDASHYRFCAGMTILSLLLKPFSCLFIFQNYRARGGVLDYRVPSGSAYVSIDGSSGASAPPPAPPPQS